MPFDLKFISTNNNITCNNNTCTLRMALLQINNIDNISKFLAQDNDFPAF